MSNKKADSLLRVLEVAGRFFVHHRFEDVSVGEIARVAHCSTATIYEVYGSKEKLYVAAMTRLMQDFIPAVITVDSRRGLHALLSCEYARVDSLVRPGTRTLFRAIVRQPEIMQRSLIAAVHETHQKTESALLPLIREALDEGSLCPLPPQSICDNIIAVGTYESTMKPLAFGIDTPVSSIGILRQAFVPLVSEQGQHILESFLREQQAKSDLRNAKAA